MRQAFIRQLVEIAKRDSRVMLLTGDLGYMALEPFIETFPDRFINCGVAEQNMVGVATGLAEAGFIPFVYSIVTFASLRPFEFIRNGPVLHGLPVRIVGIGGGVEYGHNGPSHYGLEDVGAMRLLAGLNIFCPGDAKQASTVLEKTWDLAGPSYYRLGKDEKAVTLGLDGHFEVGEAQELATGKDLLVVSMGAISSSMNCAIDILRSAGVSAAHWLISSVSPAPLTQLRSAVKRYPLIVTVEAHRRSGGIGSLVSEVAAETGSGTKVIRCGIDDYLEGKSGAQAYLEDQHGISPEKVAEVAFNELGKRSSVGHGI